MKTVFKLSADTDFCEYLTSSGDKGKSRCFFVDQPKRKRGCGRLPRHQPSQGPAMKSIQPLLLLSALLLSSALAIAGSRDCGELADSYQVHIPAAVIEGGCYQEDETRWHAWKHGWNAQDITLTASNAYSCWVPVTQYDLYWDSADCTAPPEVYSGGEVAYLTLVGSPWEIQLICCNGDNMYWAGSCGDTPDQATYERGADVSLP